MAKPARERRTKPARKRKTEAKQAPFRQVTVIGLGLIGSSLVRVIRREKLAGRIVGGDGSHAVRAKALELGIVDAVEADPARAVANSDLVVFATPISAYAGLARIVGPALSPGAIVSDVGSVKQAAIRDIAPHLPAGVALVPGHPVAGTEHSGPESGFAELFEGRWCILTPLPDGDKAALARIAWLWERAGSKVETMTADHHDLVLAITSHLPHLIAYTIVGTATDLEEHLQGEVIKYSAGGFRDFTRIAASDPIMWRDIFLNNREAVLEVLGRLHEDIAILQRAIRVGDGATLENHFIRTRAIRRGVIAAKQA
ncbi:MAG: prephenate/arogenate dehydrogenase family protein [Alphaproteobacteria bacterium]|nr:prephenate/arogenate dehydrogenase family protein [Alphaproteobacteria bacterium]